MGNDEHDGCTMMSYSGENGDNHFHHLTVQTVGNISSKKHMYPTIELDDRLHPFPDTADCSSADC